MSDPAAAPPSTWAALVALVADVREAIRGRVTLFSLELKRAGAALGQIVALGVVAAFMLHAAWFALVIGLSWIAVEHEVPSWLVLVVVLLVHVGIAAAAVLRVIALIKRIGMPGTMRHLAGKAHHQGPSSVSASATAGAGAAAYGAVDSVAATAGAPSRPSL